MGSWGENDATQNLLLEVSIDGLEPRDPNEAPHDYYQIRPTAEPRPVIVAQRRVGANPPVDVDRVDLGEEVDEQTPAAETVATVLGPLQRLRLVQVGSADWPQTGHRTGGRSESAGATVVAIAGRGIGPLTKPPLDSGDSNGIP